MPPAPAQDRARLVLESSETDLRKAMPGPSLARAVRIAALDSRRMLLGFSLGSLSQSMLVLQSDFGILETGDVIVIALLKRKGFPLWTLRYTVNPLGL